MRLRVASLLTSLLLPVMVHAAEPDDARARTAFGEAVEAYKKGQIEEALRGFEESYRLAANPLVLFNVGQTHMELEHWVEARVAFERYLREATDLKPERRAEVDERLEKLRAKTGAVHIECASAREEGALVTLDDRALGTTPLTQDEIVTAGAHVVTAKKDGVEPWRRELRVAPGERASVRLQFVAPVSLAPPPPPPPRPARKSPLIGVGWAASAALAGGAVVTAILWNGERGELEDLKARESSPAQREFSANRANLFGGLALGLGAAAIATAGVTLVFTLKAPAKSAVGGLPPQRTVRASVGAGALRVHGTF